MRTKPNLRKRLEKRIDTLPVLPTVVGKLMTLDRTSDTYFEEVLALIEADPTFAARILAAANSAADAPRARITSVRRALTRLGSTHASNTILAVAVSKVFVPRDDWEKSLWRHSLQVAVALRTLVHASPRADIRTDEAYTAGLLHDVGRFVLFGVAPAELRRIDEGDWGCPAELVSLERDICGMAHAEIGALACKRWRLPELLISVVRRHHDPDVDPARGEVDTLLAAVRFADLAMFPSAVPGATGYEDADVETLQAELVPKLPAFFDFDAASLQVLLQSSARESSAMCTMLGLT
jgi:HD-like signal output (HDOD) protein